MMKHISKFVVAVALALTFAACKAPMIENKILVDRAVVIVDVIDDQTLSVIDEIKKLDNGEPIYVVINSPGGFVEAGLQIVEALQAAKSPIITICVEGCYSMAAVIFETGDQRIMLPEAKLMFHCLWYGGNANAYEHHKYSHEALVIEKQLEKIVTDRVGMDPEAYEQLMQGELWLDASSAVGTRFADAVVNPTLYVPIVQ